MNSAEKMAKELENTIAAIGRHIGNTDNYSKMMDEIEGAPASYLEKHGIKVPEGINITGVRVFSSDSHKGESHADIEAKQKDRYVGQATWNNGHYICRVYERPNGTQYEVCWCR